MLAKNKIATYHGSLQFSILQNKKRKIASSPYHLSITDIYLSFINLHVHVIYYNIPIVVLNFFRRYLYGR